MKAGASLEQHLSMRQAERIELLLEGANNVEARRRHLPQPLQPLFLAAERAARIKPAALLQVVACSQMAAGMPAAEWFVVRVRGDEGDSLKRRALGEILGKGPRVWAAVSLLIGRCDSPTSSTDIRTGSFYV